MSAAEPARLPTMARSGSSASERPPAHLSKESAAVWREIVGEFSLEAHHREILAASLQARDRMHEARAEIDRTGAYIEGRFGMKAHPALAVERDARNAYLKGIRELGLDLEAPATSRPPSRFHR